MNNFRLTHFLTSNVDFDSLELEALISNCTMKQLAKGEFVLREGDICNHSFFVEKGLLRQYSIDDKGKEHIIQFAPESWFVSDRESMYFGRPSHFFIQAVEESVVMMIDDQFMAEITKQNPAFIEFNNKLLHNHIRHLQFRIKMLLSATAEERYLEFVKIYPDILLRVPQTMVASYLGITPESLSRVHRELATKNFKK